MNIETRLTMLLGRGVLLLCAATALKGQGTARDTVSKSADKAPIADNSFLLEEAYNQERGVVQHISSFSQTTGSRAWGYSFTQEWPLGGMRHQLSYTVPFARAGDPLATGIGDVMINYRFQAIFDERRGLAFSPRFSVSIPTGNIQKGLGLGGTGVQASLPVSRTLGHFFVSHTNVGATWFARAPGAGDGSTSLSSVNLGQSFVWLAASRFNVLVETIWTRTNTRSTRGTTTDDAAFIMPAVRWGYDFPSGLQIVPGIGVPIGFGPSHGTRQLFLYLSFEHPFQGAAN